MNREKLRKRQKLIETSTGILHHFGNAIQLFSECYKEQMERGTVVPQKPKTSYLLFCDTIRDSIKKERPDLTFVEASKLMGERWQKASQEEKDRFQVLFKSNKKKYLHDMEIYEYNVKTYTKEQGKKGIKRDNTSEIKNEEIFIEETDRLLSEEDEINSELDELRSWYSAETEENNDKYNGEEIEDGEDEIEDEIVYASEYESDKEREYDFENKPKEDHTANKFSEAVYNSANHSPESSTETTGSYSPEITHEPLSEKLQKKDSVIKIKQEYHEE